MAGSGAIQNRHLPAVGNVCFCGSAPMPRVIAINMHTSSIKPYPSQSLALGALGHIHGKRCSSIAHRYKDAKRHMQGPVRSLNDKRKHITATHICAVLCTANCDLCC